MLDSVVSDPEPVDCQVFILFTLVFCRLVLQPIGRTSISRPRMRDTMSSTRWNCRLPTCAADHIICDRQMAIPDDRTLDLGGLRQPSWPACGFTAPGDRGQTDTADADLMCTPLHTSAHELLRQVGAKALTLSTALVDITIAPI